jgi:hypothetical protein
LRETGRCSEPTVVVQARVSEGLSATKSADAQVARGCRRVYEVTTWLGSLAVVLDPRAIQPSESSPLTETHMEASRLLGRTGAVQVAPGSSVP